jgi:hypothetical protein
MSQYDYIEQAGFLLLEKRRRRRAKRFSNNNSIKHLKYARGLLDKKGALTRPASRHERLAGHERFRL